MPNKISECECWTLKIDKQLWTRRLIKKESARVLEKQKNKKNKKENLNESQEKTAETAQEQRKQQQTLLSIMKIEIKINQM